MKKMFLLPLLFLLFISNGYSQLLETGKFSFDYTLSGYNLDKFSGERIFTYDVKFKKKLEVVPEIIFAVSSVDASNEDNLRYRIESSLITNEGFLLKIKIWGKSKLYSIAGNWLALKAEDM
ncbi:MAG: H-type lectin domain-containing protein [Ignavibacteria bacterium]|jgi:hypothetical protein|nr:H-type lectin domain-containing protein [Ignavibacteria bacterium]MDP3831243.1 H-type lectin domain-containing protein [Ignavibacteriaceae bacterium]